MATRMKTKAAARKANADKRPRTIARYIRISSRKAKIVLDLIRGKKAEEAQAILMYTPKSAAPMATATMVLVFHSPTSIAPTFFFLISMCNLL